MDVGYKIGHYYPIGNCLPIDLTVGCNVPDDVTILLLGCGDIRNILYTIHTLHINEIYPKKPIKFHLNDNQIGILARAILLLYIVNNIDPTNEEDIKFLWAVWYDCFLTKQHGERLQRALNELKYNWRNLHIVGKHDEFVAKLIDSVFNEWTKENMSVAEVKETRDWLLKLTSDYKGSSIADVQEHDVQEILEKFTNIYRKLSSDRTLHDSCLQEIKNFVEMGITDVNLGGRTKEEIFKSCVVNQTLIRPGDKTWLTELTASAFYAYDCDLSRLGDDKNTITSLCIEQLIQWVTSYQLYGKTTYKQQYTLWFDDAICLLNKDVLDGLQFDFIHTSNLSDYLGLLSLLVSCQPYLKRDNGILITQMFKMFTLISKVEDIFDKFIGCSPALLPTLIGLQSADDLEIGTEDLMLNKENVYTFHWKVARDLCTLNIKDGQADVGIQAIQRIFTCQNFAYECEEQRSIKCNQQGSFTRPNILRRLSSFCADESYKYLLDVARQEDFAALLGSETTFTRPDKKETQIVVTDLKEFETYFDVEFKMDSMMCTGKFKIEYSDDSRKDCVCFSFTTGSTTIKHDCQLSCPVLMSSSKVKLQRQVGKVSMELVKDFSLQAKCLPFRTSFSDVTQLEDYKNTENNDRFLYDVRIHRVYPQFNRSLLAVENVKPWNVLKELLFSFYVEFNSAPLSRTWLVLNGDSSQLKSYNMMFTVDRFKILQCVPTLIVRWVDFDQVMIDEKTTESDVMRAIHQICDFPHVYNLKKISMKLHSSYTYAFELLKKMLILNSCRCKQTHRNDVTLPWQNSFIRPRYPIQPISSYILNTNVTEVFKSGPEIRLRVQEEMKSGSSFMVACESYEVYRPLVNRLVEITPPMCNGNHLVICNFCYEIGVSFKRCSDCHAVYYCGKDCQRKDWNQHKVPCKKHSRQ